MTIRNRMSLLIAGLSVLCGGGAWMASTSRGGGDPDEHGTVVTSPRDGPTHALIQGPKTESVSESATQEEGLRVDEPSEEEPPPRAERREPPRHIPNPLAFEDGQAIADFAQEILDADLRGESHGVLCVLQAQEFLDRFTKIERWMETGMEEYANAYLENPELSWPDVVASCP